LRWPRSLFLWTLTSEIYLDNKKVPLAQMDLCARDP